MLINETHFNSRLHLRIFGYDLLTANQTVKLNSKLSSFCNYLKHGLRDIVISANFQIVLS